MTGRDERGTGLLATTLGLVFVLAFTLLAVHVTLRLRVAAGLSADAAHAARVVAGDAVQRGGPGAVATAVAAQDARLHARYRDRHLETAWSLSGGSVRVRLAVDPPDVLAGFAGLLGLGPVTASASVHQEVP